MAVENEIADTRVLSETRQMEIPRIRSRENKS
jgi:hypothetical protein